MAAWSGRIIPMALAVVVSAPACGGDLPPESDAVLSVARELKDELSSFAPDQTVVLAPEWIGGGNLPSRLLDRLQEVTALSIRDAVANPDAGFAALFFHRPDPVDLDSVQVGAELLTFEAARFYGREWRFLLNCRESCEVVQRTEKPGWVN